MAARTIRQLAAVVIGLLIGACAGRGAAPDPSSSSPFASAETTRAPVAEATPSPATEDPRRVAPDTSRPRPDWLGTRILETDADGVPLPVDTPVELEDRAFAPGRERFPTPTVSAFGGSVDAVSPDVAARSTWQPDCPVSLDELRHVTVTFVGFDGLVHRGELLVNHEVADDVLGVFRALHDARFPLEDVAIATQADLEADPTGDGNVSGGFVCRPSVGSTRWSAHAYGMAVDLNPFQNPYVRRGRVIPELATTYTDRSRIRPGMITDGDVATVSFATIGWTWGGSFQSLTDPMHFSADGS